MNNSLQGSIEWDRVWKDDEVIRQRWHPLPGDADYLVLSDLRLFLEQFKTGTGLKVLDFGAGASPYRGLFPAAAYHRADFIRTEGIDFTVDDHSHISVSSESYDMVLTTQVAEHVEYPQEYMSECYRLLRPGGTLILTTHGAWEDHGVPYDFQRWTADGLKRDVSKAGFAEVQTFKLTTASRAYCYLFQKWMLQLELGTGFVGKCLSRGVSLLARLLRRPIHLAADRVWPHRRVVAESGAGNEFYMVVACIATRSVGQTEILPRHIEAIK